MFLFMYMQYTVAFCAFFSSWPSGYLHGSELLQSRVFRPMTPLIVLLTPLYAQWDILVQSNKNEKN